MRVLVTGSRQFLDRRTLHSTLDFVYHEWRPTADADESLTIVHGGAVGADALANQWCWDRRHMFDRVAPPEMHPADWRRGNMAGRIRNVEMVRLGADLVLAFFQSGARNAGTRHCVEEARRWLPHVEIREVWNERV